MIQRNYIKRNSPNPQRNINETNETNETNDMDEFLAMMGWYNSGVCGCTPKKYTWKNNDFPDYKIKITPSRGTWQLFEHDVRIRLGQHMSLESQYSQQFEQQQQ